MTSHVNTVTLIVSVAVLNFLCLVGHGIAAEDDPLAGLTTVELWPDSAPGAVGNEPADRPTLSLFLPEPQPEKCAAVVVCLVVATVIWRLGMRGVRLVSG